MSRYFKGTTTQNPLDYRCGERIEFDLQLIEDEKNTCCPLIQWETHGDDDKHTRGYESGESGSIKVLGTLDVPGFLRVIVRACDLNGKPINSIDVYEGGAGMEIEKIDQGMLDPAD